MDNHSKVQTVDLFEYLRSRIEDNMPPRSLSRMLLEEAGEVADGVALDRVEACIRADRARVARQKTLEMAKEIIREHEGEEALLALKK